MVSTIPKKMAVIEAGSGSPDEVEMSERCVAIATSYCEKNSLVTNSQVRSVNERFLINNPKKHKWCSISTRDLEESQWSPSWGSLSTHCQLKLVLFRLKALWTLINRIRSVSTILLI